MGPDLFEHLDTRRATARRAIPPQCAGDLLCPQAPQSDDLAGRCYYHRKLAQGLITVDTDARRRARR